MKGERERRCFAAFDGTSEEIDGEQFHCLGLYNVRKQCQSEVSDIDKYLVGGGPGVKLCNEGLDSVTPHKRVISMSFGSFGDSLCVIP